MVLSRCTAAVLAAFLAVAWSNSALACACDKEARIKKYGTLKLVHQAVPPATPAAPVPMPPLAPTPGS